MDSGVHFVTIFDTNNEKIFNSEHKPGVTNLLSKEESQESLQLALLMHGKHVVNLNQKLEKENMFLQNMKR